VAIDNALKIVRETGDLAVPLSLRNAPTKLMKDMNYGREYQYAHNFQNNFVPIEFLPEELKNTKFYDPGNNAREEEMRVNLRKLWKDKYNY
jgi:putative ATPase